MPLSVNPFRIRKKTLPSIVPCFLVSVYCILFLLLPCSVKAQDPKLILPVGHTHRITLASFSPDSKKIATGSEDKTIKIWDVATGRLLADLKGHSGEITSLSFNSAGSRLLTTASMDTIAKLWDPKTGLLVKNIHTGPYAIDLAVFSPDGKMIVTNTHNNAPCILNSETGLPLIRLKESTKNIERAVFSPDNKKLLIVESSSGEPEIRDTETGALLQTLKGHTSFVKVLAFTPDGRAVTTSYDNTIKIWDTNSGQLIFDLKGHTKMPVSVSFSQDGKRMTSAGLSDAAAKLWDLENGKYIADLGGNDYSLQSVSFSSDHKTIITSGTSVIKIWDAVTGLPGTPGSVKSSFAQYIPGQEAYIMTDNNETRIITGQDENKPIVFQNCKGLTFAAFNTGSNKIAGILNDGKNLGIWDTQSGRLLAELKGMTASVDHAYLSDDRKHIVTQSYQNTAIWNIDNNLFSPVTDPINESMEILRYSPDGKSIVRLNKSDDQLVSLWDGETLNLINPDLKKSGMQRISNYSPGSFVFSADSRKLFLSNNDWGSYILDGKTGDLLKEIKHERAWFSTINPAADKFIATVENKLSLIDIASGSMVNNLNTKDQIDSAVFIDPENRFITYGTETLGLYTVNGKRPLLEIPNGRRTFNTDKSKLMVWTYAEINIWDLKKTSLQTTVKMENTLYESILSAIWSFDNKYVIYSTSNGKIKIIDAASGAKINEISGYAITLDKSKNGLYLFGIYNEDVFLYDAKTFKPISQLKGHINKVSSIVVLPDPSKILTVSEDNTARVWELNTGKLLYTYLMLDRNYTFSIIPSGYYMANPNASKLLHYVTPDLKVISFEQLDVKYNRPDKVLEAIGSPDTAMINSYRKAYEKRMRKLGIDTASFRSGYSIPQADFKDRHLIDYDQKKQQLTLHITGADSVYKLDRFNVWINETPLFGMRGVSLKSNKQNTVDTTITITLSDGSNRIETSVTNLNGIESYRMPLFVNYIPDKASEEKLHFIGIGINEFAQTGHNLKWSVKDVRDQARALREKYGDRISIDTLFDQQVSVSNINGLRKKLDKSSVNDKVILAYSGHGMLSKDLDYYLSTYMVNFSKPEENGLSYDALESLFDGIPARKKLMLIDACHSGEVDKEEMAKLKTAETSLNATGVSGAKGTDITNISAGKLGMTNSFELMQSLFANVSRSTGTTVISAAAGTQFALEKNDLQNGVFSYSIMEFMKAHPHTSVSSLKQYVNKRVSELTAGMQVPTARNENNAIDWEVW